MICFLGNKEEPKALGTWFPNCAPRLPGEPPRTHETTGYFKLLWETSNTKYLSDPCQTLLEQQFHREISL